MTSLTSLSGSFFLSEPSFWFNQIRFVVAQRLKFLAPAFNIAKTTKEKLDLLYLIFIGACEVAEKYNQQEAMKELITVSKIQKWFLRYEAILEKSNYLGDVEVEEKWNLCLNALYKLEGEIRLKAYSNQQKVNSDKQFLLALTAKSKETLGGVFLRHVA